MSWSCSQDLGQEAGTSQRRRGSVPQHESPTPQLPTLASAPRSSISLEGCKDAGWTTSGSLTSVGRLFLTDYFDYVQILENKAFCIVKLFLYLELNTRYLRVYSSKWQWETTPEYSNYLVMIPFLSLDTMVWSTPETRGSNPLPRSLHSANVIGNKYEILYCLWYISV